LRSTTLDCILDFPEQALCRRSCQCNVALSIAQLATHLAYYHGISLLAAWTAKIAEKLITGKERDQESGLDYFGASDDD
jgi:hypothetical protein